MRPFRRLVAAGALALIASQPIFAATLFGVVSERAAPVAVEAARQHLAAQRGDRIVLRTPAQLQAASDKQVAQWLGEADAVLAVAVFGEPARRLRELLPKHARAETRVFAFNGEQTLNTLTRIGRRHLADFPGDRLRTLGAENPPADALAAAKAHPVAAAWLAARQTWQAGGAGNQAAVFKYLLGDGSPPEATAEASLRVRIDGRETVDAAAWRGGLLKPAPTLVVLDLAAYTDPAPADALCAESRRQGLQCAAVIARWGGESRAVVERLRELVAPATPAAVVVLQDFVVGGSENREAVTSALTKLNVPVLKALRLTERSALQWRLSPDGLPPDSVQYRVALPELQGTSQPVVIAAAGTPRRDALTGIEFKPAQVLVDETRRLVARAVRWQALALKPNSDKRIAIVYYNHPPGRQNIGADNLDVPASLFDLLHALKAAGYTVGELPASKEALLDLIMARGVNLPEDRQALRELAREVEGVGTEAYKRWFSQLPERVQGEMQYGLLGRLHAEVLEAEKAGERELGRKRVETALKELHHLAEGANHARRLDAIKMLRQLEAGYLGCLADPKVAGQSHERALPPLQGEGWGGDGVSGQKNKAESRRFQPHPPPVLPLEGGGTPLPAVRAIALPKAAAKPTQRAASCARLAPLKDKILALGVEGLRGWGPAPGKVMVEGERLLVPGLRFGNVFVGPQPPRGWEVDEELLHANTSVPPPHQYLAFYHFLRDRFQADALVHLGRHSTYEFLPGKAVGLTADDYPSLIAGELPGIYPYIVDGVGEGIQAKRRGLAVMVDHLTPPIATTPLYDQLLTLRQVVESYEAAGSDALRAQAARTIRQQVEALHLKAEIEASMADVLKVRGIGFDDADDDLLAHEVGHYLTKLQEKFMPYGLHVFGREWSPEYLALMLDSMQKGGLDVQALAAPLQDSPRQEMASFLNALAGGFVPPGKGNDPLRSPESLPTGRNFHAVDGDLLPTRIGYALGHSLAEKAMAKAPRADGSEAVILWASDAVRDEGVMVAFALSLMGAEPVWNARGIVTDVRLIDNAARRDVLVTTSGLFRDLYPNLLRLIDRAARLALAAGAKPLLAERPDLQPALDAALAPLGKTAAGDEALAGNHIAARWLARTEALIAQGMTPAIAGREAAQRIFGDAPGAYGAGVNRLTERSGAWREREQIGKVYRTRLGHAYGLDGDGQAAHAAFDLALKDVTRSYHGRASHLYGLLDNNDAFDYLGGLSLAVESISGRRPEGLILQHAEAGRAEIEPLATALMGELRGRYLNPAWIKPLMGHGYAGARTMGQEFVENLWGWQVTRPDLIQNWAWDEVKKVYFDDSHQLGLSRFLGEGQNAHVKAHMLAIFMVAAQKGFWQTDAATINKLGSELARLVAKNGLPGSGHTAPRHLMWDWLLPQLDAAHAQALGVTLARARGEMLSAYAARPAAESPASSAAKQPTPGAAEATTAAAAEAVAAEALRDPARYYELERPAAPPPIALPLAALPLFALLFLGGLLRGRRGLPLTRPTGALS